MAFLINSGVRPRKNTDTTAREPVCFVNPTTKPVFVCVVGRYKFTNSVSATVFAYLNSRLGSQVASAAVIRMEEKLDKWGARWSDKAPSAFDLVALTPIGKYLEIGKKAIETGGASFMKQQVSNRQDWSQYNPYEPTTSSRWTGTGSDEYVDYALAYWGKYKDGPAYKLLRDNPAVKNR